MVYDVCSGEQGGGAKLSERWVLRATDSPRSTGSTCAVAAGAGGEGGGGAGGGSVGQEPPGMSSLASSGTSVEGGGRGSDGGSASSGKDDMGEAGLEESGRNYPYEEAFFMAEFTPSGEVFAVRELPYETTLVHLISPQGQVLRTVDLMERVGGEEGRKRPVNTVFISAFHRGVFAVGLEGGRIVIMDAEQLQLKKVFKVVSEM